MNRIFNMDNKFFTFMGRVADLCMLNIICLICCIPIVTAGASITALYYVTMKMVRNEESYIFRSFFKSFKQNFKQATIIHLIMLAVAVILYMDLNIVKVMGGLPSRILTFVFIAFSFVYALLLLYIYPNLAKFYNTIKNTFSNAILMSIRHLPYSLLMLVICLCPLAILFVPNFQIQSSLILIFILMGFAVIAYCNSVFLVKIFDNYIPEEESANEVSDELE